MTRRWCDGPTLLRAVSSAVANLERHVAEVDALNVFPVPDGDTGSNMLATMRAALAEARAIPDDERDLERVAEALSRGALLGARGNSGVILSQIIRGMTEATTGRRTADGLHLSAALRQASESAYGSLQAPVEGTILTVIREAAEAAATAAQERPFVELVMMATVQAAARSVERTPQLLPVLAEAGVVDSGGQGLFRLLEGTLLTDLRAAAPGPAAVDRTPVGRIADDGGHEAGLHHGDGFGYEVMYLVTGVDGSLDIGRLRAELAGMADSVVIAGDARVARVHAHTDRPDLALGAGLAHGHLAQVTLTDLDEQTRGRAAHDGEHGAVPAASVPVRSGSVGLVAVAPGDGLAALYAGVGASGIVRPSQGLRPSSGEIAGAIAASAAAHIVILPNDRDGILAAQQAAELMADRSVSIVPTRDAAQGVAALLAFDPRLPVDKAVELMREAAASVRSFRVTRAARDSTLAGQRVTSGQALALDATDALLAVAAEPVGAVERALATMSTGFELVTIYSGRQLDDLGAQAMVEAIRGAWPDVEVEVIRGGHPSDILLVAVE